uniref:Uncharacterized protein n=1 Tax=Ciona savignyi TaxID=51511 RepID=H2ZEI1_CIOSA
MENIDAAKDCLKRIYIKAKNGLLRDEAEAKLRPVIKMCHINRELSMEDTEINRKYSLHEALADLYCKVGCFAPALKHYKCQEVLLDLIEGITKHQRKAVYFSIASTLVDLNKFQEALTYYNKELDVSTDNMELADIHMNIAKCLESNSSSVDEVMSSCQKAIQCAENSGIDR